MKFVAPQNAILKALMLVSGGIAKTPEHSMVKIEAEKLSNLVTFKTKNLDISVEAPLPAKVENSGHIAVELVKLIEIIKKLNPNLEVDLEAKNSTLYIKSGKSEFSIVGMVPKIEANNHNLNPISSSFRIMAKKLLSLINKTEFSIYPDGTRFNLNGLLFEFKKDGETPILNAVSTDGHRLSLFKIEAELPEGASSLKMIIPKNNTSELKKILEKITDDEEMEVKLSSKQITFSCKSVNDFTSKLIDAEFPDYQAVIPKENSKIATISRKNLISLIERVCAIYTNSTENRVKLNFNNNLLKVFASASKTENGGENGAVATDELDISFEPSEEIEVGYNYRYLLEILNHISSDNIRFCLKDKMTPAIIKDEKLDSYFYILMPMRA